MTLTTYVKIIQIGGGSPILHNYHNFFKINKKYSLKKHFFGHIYIGIYLSSRG